jgi:hypothetical protein
MHIENQSQANNKTQERDAAIQIITSNGQLITSVILDGTTYYTTTRRGVEYTAYRTSGGNWWVSSSRLALGRQHIGGGRYYSDLEAVATGCKAFACLPLMLEISTDTAN